MKFLLFFFLAMAMAQSPVQPTPTRSPDETLTAPENVGELPCLSLRTIQLCRRLNSEFRPGLCGQGESNVCTNSTFTDHPTFNGLNCPSCLPRSAIRPWCKNRVEPCGDTAEPTLAFALTNNKLSICPTCYVAQEDASESCSRTDITVCTATLVAAGVDGRCEEGERPTREGCCPSCTPRSMIYCAANAENDRRSLYRSKDVCVQDEEPVVGEDCVPSCRAPASRSRAPGTRCSREDFLTSIRNARECEPLERGITDEQSESCGPSCRRPESSYELNEVVECIKDLRRCEQGEEPVQLLGSRCKSCVGRRPTCEPACEEREVCARGSRRNGGTPRCVRKGIYTLRFRTRVGSSLGSSFRSFTNNDQPTRVLIEIVERFCERNSVESRCERFLGAVQDSLRCNRRREDPSNENEHIVEIEIAETEETSSSRRLLSEDDTPLTLIQDAVTDVSEDVEGAVTVAPTPEDNNSFKNKLSGLVILLSMMNAIFMI